MTTLEEVEDELTGIPNDPTRWQSDGRLYPPQRDNWSQDPDRPRVTRMRTKGHYVFIADNGAVEIREVRSRMIVFALAGSDGREVGAP